MEKERLKHWRDTCTFVAFLNIHSFITFFSFHLGCKIYLFEHNCTLSGKKRVTGVQVAYNCTRSANYWV